MPTRYKPDTIAQSSQLTTQELVQYLSRELEKVGQAIEGLDQGRRDVQYTEPTKKRTGLLAYADGTKWDPGEGAGMYVYTGSAWRRLAPEVWSTFLPDLQFGGVNAGITYGIRTGVYTQIGRLVQYYLRVQLTNKGAAVGQALIQGMPVSCPTFGGAQQLYAGGMGAANTGAHGYVNGTTLILLTNAAGNAVVLTNADFTNGSDLIYSGVYYT
jgi:hypothetical protein